MMAPKSKTKVTKRPAGLVIRPPAPRAEDDNPALQIFREAKAAEAAPLPPPPTTTYHHPPPSTQEIPATAPVAPRRDFTKVPNSVARDAMPAGIFKGTSKKLYDALYQRTRGAVQPSRRIQARQSDLMAWARVSHNTLRAHLRHLEGVGLVVRQWELGDNDGAVYEVFTPEELSPAAPSYHLQPPPTTNQKLGGPSNQNLVVGGGGQVAEDAATSGDSKTLIKTNTERDDDEAFGPLLAAAKEITGREVGGRQWRELAEVLAAELRIAAGRTTVSSAPAFLAEHLRRRLWKKDKRQIAEEGKAEISDSAIRNSVDVSKCPDCFGTGMYYPEGYEKGVAKCRHEKLATDN